MQTVLFKQISEYKIIIGFGNLTPDPIETKKKVDRILLKNKTGKDIVKLEDEIKSLNKEISKIHQFIPHMSDNIELLRLAKPTGKLPLSKTQIQQAIDCINKKKEIYKELTELKLKQTEERKKLTKEDPVYFEPTRYEIVKTDKEIESLKSKFKSLSKTQLLDTDGNIVANHTGIKYFLKRDKWIIKEYKIGEVKDPDAKTSHELTKKNREEIEEQFDKERINLLSDSDRTAEKEKAIEELQIESVNKNTSFEIQGNTHEEAIEKSKKWYKSRLKQIEKKYG